MSMRQFVPAAMAAATLAAAVLSVAPASAQDAQPSIPPSSHAPRTSSAQPSTERAGAATSAQAAPSNEAPAATVPRDPDPSTAQTPQQAAGAPVAQPAAPSETPPAAAPPVEPAHSDQARAEAEPSDESIAAPSPAEVAAAARLAPSTRSFELQRVAHLDTAIRDLAQLDTATKYWGGIGAIVLCAVGVAAGVLIAVDDDLTWGGGARAALSGAAIAGGLSAAAAAIFRMSDRTPAERRLDHWNALLQTHQLNALEIGRFEGALEAEAEHARALRLLNGAGLIGLFASGGTLIAFSAFDVFDNRDARTAGYVIGGIAAGIGAVNAALAFLVDSPAETVWKKYVRAQQADLSSLRLHRTEGMASLALQLQ